MEGQLGDRMTFYRLNDSKSDNNHYYMQYKALNENETIREINAGNRYHVQQIKIRCL
jgi:hypothetical protein